MNDNLFFKVFRNKFIFNLILNHLNLLIRYRVVEFKNLKEFEEFKHIDYIYHLIYNGDNNQEIKIINQLLLKSTYQGVLNKIEISKLTSNLINIPNGIKQVSLFGKFIEINSILIKLPNSIQDLFISKTIEPINNPLPLNIKTFKIQKFNQTITQSQGIFKNVTNLDLGNKWNNCSNKLNIGDLHHGIKKLKICGYENKLYKKVIPDSMESLSISSQTFRIFLKRSLPNSISKLKIINNKGIPDNLVLKEKLLPKYLKKLEFKHITSMCIKSLNSGIFLKELVLESIQQIFFKKDSLPIGLNTFIFTQYKTYNFIGIDIKPGVFTSSLTCLTYLSIAAEFKNPISIGIFSNLKNLKTLILSDYNHPLDIIGVFPSSLTNLQLLGNFNNLISVGVIPSLVSSISFGTGFNTPIGPNVLPLSVLYLEFYIYSLFNQDINQENVLPKNLLELKINSFYKKVIEIKSLPSNLNSISIYNKNKHLLSYTENEDINNNFNKIVKYYN